MKKITVSELALQQLDPDSPVPLYHQIETHLRRLIESGALAPNDLLPPETELARMYGVGRHTVRMALSRLATEHLIARKSGRGTFVKPPADRTRFYLDRSFTRQMADLGLTARSRVLHTETGTIDELAPDALRAQLGAPCLRLMRLRFGDDEPVGLQETIIITSRCPDIERFDFNQHSLYDVLFTHYRLAIAQITHVVTAVLADPVQADLLALTAGDPLLLVRTAAYLDNQDLIEVTTSHYRADKYEYSTTYTFRP